MTLTKQTVYLPVNNEWEEGKPGLMSSDGEWICNLYQNIGYFFTPEQLNEYTANVIRQTLETAAENIGFIETTSEKLNSEEYKPFITADDDTVWTIDKESITNTFEETYNKLKV